MANESAYGLSSAVFTRDGERGVRFARRSHVSVQHRPRRYPI